MPSLIDKIKSEYTDLRKPKISFEKKGIRPREEWSIILSTAFLLLIISALVAFYLFIQIDRGTFFKVESTDYLSEVKINNTLLKNVVGDIDRREQRLLEIKNEKAAPADPSF